MKLIILLVLFPLIVIASPKPQGAICLITGKVTKVISRDEVYKDQQWAKSWGLPKSVLYTDVYLNVRSSKELKKGYRANDCSKLIPKFVFQLREKKIELKHDSCIKAKTQHRGDEFSHGQWLYDIELTACNK